MTDWWRQDTPDADGERPAEPRLDPEPIPPAPLTPPAPPVAEAAAGQKRSRKGLIITAVAAVAVAGTLWAVAPDSPAEPKAGPQETGQPQELFPAAGGGPQEASSVDAREGVTADEKAPGRIEMTRRDAGTGRTGILVELTIRNGTDKQVTVTANLFMADGRTGMVGEGTLAPGSRIIPPGSEVTGTVEFAGRQKAAQVVLADFEGLVLATAG